MVPRKVQTGKHERGIGEEKNNSFRLGGVGKAPLWRQTGTWGIIECWWAKWPGEGMAFPGWGNSVSENMETRESRMFREFFVGLGDWKWEGKWKDVESLTLWILKKVFLEHMTASMWWYPNECATVPSVDACHSWRLQSDPLLLQEDIKACYSALKTLVPWLHITGRTSCPSQVQY